MYNREYLVCGTCAGCGLLSHLSHVGVSMCAGYLMSSTKRLKSLGHRGTSAPTLVVLFYDCPFDSDRGSEGSRPREATARQIRGLCALAAPGASTQGKQLAAEIAARPPAPAIPPVQPYFYDPVP